MSGSDAGEAAHRVAAERRLTTVDPRLREQEAGEHEEQHDRDPQLADRAVEQVRAPGPGPVRVRVHPHVQHDDGQRGKTAQTIQRMETGARNPGHVLVSRV